MVLKSRISRIMEEYPEGYRIICIKRRRIWTLALLWLNGGLSGGGVGRVALLGNILGHWTGQAGGYAPLNEWTGLMRDDDLGRIAGLAGKGRVKQASETSSEVTAIAFICTLVVCHLACIAQWCCLARARRCHMNIMDG